MEYLSHLLKKRKKLVATIVAMVVLVLFFRAKILVRAGFLTISFDQHGKVSFSVSQGVEIPILLGIGPVNVEASSEFDPSQYLNQYHVSNVLVVRMNGEEMRYDLHGQRVHIDFSGSGYLDTPDGLNWLLVVEAAGSAVAPSIPGQVNQQNGPILNPCPDSLRPHLRIGGRGYVTPGYPNSLNAEPNKQTKGPTNRLLTLIPVGGEFTILDGPVCADTITWWKVDYNGTVGWTGESGESDGTYWVSLVP